MAPCPCQARALSLRARVIRMEEVARRSVSLARGGSLVKRAPTIHIVRAIAIASPLSILACGPPVLYDTDLEPVRNPLIVASVENGWMAVDSSEAGVRAGRLAKLR